MRSRRDCTWILGLPGFQVERIDSDERSRCGACGAQPDSLATP